MSCRSRLTGGTLEPDESEHEGLQLLAAFQSEYMFESMQIQAVPAPITPLQTSYTDDEDRPVAVYR